MCGICGIFDYRAMGAVKGRLLYDMCNKIVHRGPDEEGYYLDKYIGLGIRRLAIIDLDTGQQPIYNETGHICVINNGEIYNFRALRDALEKKGHRFYTKSDTEVIVHLYEEYDLSFVKHLRGMFALALWDSNKKRLCLCRDRLGKKPLNYTLYNGRLIFGSEIKSILTYPGITNEVNIDAIHYYLTYQYIPTPMTIFKEIKKIPPATILCCDEKGGITSEQYWDLDFKNKLDLSTETYGYEIRERLKEAVKLRMISDVPLGAFLSGGIDSSAIVGFMSELGQGPVRTFSIGFEEQDFSELEYARIVAKHFGTEHTEFIVKPRMIETLPKIIWHYGEPFADPSALPSFYLAKETKRHVTVALNGDGGDEGFAGYNRYKTQKRYSLFSTIYKYLGGGIANDILKLFPQPLSRMNPVARAKRLSSRLCEPQAYSYIQWHYYFNNEQKNLLYTDGMKKMLAHINALDYMANIYLNALAKEPMDRILYTDIKTYLPEDLLVKMDIATMANSLEVRSPFLDQEFMEFTAQIPANLKLYKYNLKYILKQSLKGLLPDIILDRKKMGFGIPLAKWLRTDMKDYTREILLSDTATKRGYFNNSYVEQLINEHQSGYTDHGTRLWALLILELWHRIYIDGEG